MRFTVMRQIYTSQLGCPALDLWNGSGIFQANSTALSLVRFGLSSLDLFDVEKEE